MYEFLEKNEYGKVAKVILEFYVPLALSLPSLRANAALMDSRIKGTNQTGAVDYVTNADLYVQNEIKKFVRTKHPDWQFWGEEGRDNTKRLEVAKKFLFITDPIEGTNNFIAGKDEAWGSVVALVEIEHNEPIFGVVAHPVKNIFYVGLKGGGAWEIKYADNGKILSLLELTKEPEFQTFTYNNSPHFEVSKTKMVEKFLEVLKSKNEKDNFIDPESGALEAVRYRGTIYFKTSNEMAAVFVILGEIGGKVTDFDGNKWSLGINTMVSARNSKDYEYLLNLVRLTRENK